MARSPRQAGKQPGKAEEGAGEAKPSYRTLQARPNAASLIKPGELVDLIEVTPLTLVDRRIYNQLLEHAWDAIDKPVTHVIAKSALRGSHNSNDRIGESIERLMSAIVRISVARDGQPAIERVQLLGGNVETLRRDGLFEYEIPPRLRRIIKDSTVFARLQREVMFALTSKYALTLYEMVQKRGNLKWRDSERFSLADLRGILGVPKGRLTTWSNLRLRALDPAVKEVNRLSDYVVELTPVKTGRSVTHVELRWWKKDSAGQGAAARELSYSKVGRKARGEGRTEEVVPEARGGVVPEARGNVVPEARGDAMPEARGHNVVPKARGNVVPEARGNVVPEARGNVVPEARGHNVVPMDGPTGQGAPRGGKPRPAWLDRQGPALAPSTYETARLRHPGFDVYAVESEWRRWAATKTPARDPDRAYLAFFRKYAEAHPL